MQSRLDRTPQANRSDLEPEEPPAKIAPLQNVSELMSQKINIVDKTWTTQNTHPWQCNGTRSA